MVVHMMIVMMHMVMHVRPRRGGGHHPRDRGGGPRGGGHRGGTGRSAGHCFLRKGVTRETDRESDRGDKALNHRKLSLLETPTVSNQRFANNLPEPRMNDAEKISDRLKRRVMRLPVCAACGSNDGQKLGFTSALCFVSRLGAGTRFAATFRA